MSELQLESLTQIQKYELACISSTKYIRDYLAESHKCKNSESSQSSNSSESSHLSESSHSSESSQSSHSSESLDSKEESKEELKEEVVQVQHIKGSQKSGLDRWKKIIEDRKKFEQKRNK